MAREKTGLFASDNWRLSRAETSGGPIFVRFRAELPDQKDLDNFPLLMVVRWKFPPASNTSAPPADVLKQMEAFEDRIIEVSDSEREWGSCAVVLTVHGTREWRFYARDESSFVEGFNKALAGHDPYPLTIEAFQDPDWNGLKEFQR